MTVNESHSPGHCEVLGICFCVKSCISNCLWYKGKDFCNSVRSHYRSEILNVQQYSTIFRVECLKPSSRRWHVLPLKSTCSIKWWTLNQFRHTLERSPLSPLEQFQTVNVNWRSGTDSFHEWTKVWQAACGCNAFKHTLSLDTMLIEYSISSQYGINKSVLSELIYPVI